MNIVLSSNHQNQRPAIVRLICFIDLIQPAILIFLRAWAIIFHTVPFDEDDYAYVDHSSAIVVITFAVVICFYVIHMTIALKLLSAVDVMEVDPLTAARNTKVWQTWSILFLVFLLGSFVVRIISVSSKFSIVFVTIIGFCEILWRLFGIYQVGGFIDDLVAKIPSVTLIPTVQFFKVRFPIPGSSEDEQI